MGPTGSGKSALAIALAQALDGEVVNADSMQVYRDLRVLTARPTPEEEAAAPHHLFGVIDGAERFSVGRWLRTAAPILAEIRARGRTPIVVGGTGLYFKALTEGLAEIPEPPADIVAALRARAETEGPAALHAELAARDPEGAARLQPMDAPRIVRALSVIEATGEPIGALQAAAAAPPTETHWLGFALTPDRARLYAAIEQRFQAMLANGAMDEVSALAARRLDPTLPIMKAHGAPWLTRAATGDMELAQAAALSVRDTRRYAKRQFTWIAHQAAGFFRLDEENISSRMNFVTDRVSNSQFGAKILRKDCT